MTLKEWAAEQGIHYQTAYRWFRKGVLPVPARKETRKAEERLQPLHQNQTNTQRAPSPHRVHPRRRSTQTHHQPRQNPRRDSGRGLERRRDETRRSETPSGRQPRQIQAPDGLQDRMVRIDAHTSRQVLPVLKDMLRLRACPRDQI